jgi:hypothetical protein
LPRLAGKIVPPGAAGRDFSCEARPPISDIGACISGRFYGLRLEGVWMHVGTPEAIAAPERAILASAA